MIAEEGGGMSPIDPRLQEAFDGERDPAGLPADLRDAHDRLMTAATLLQATPPLSVAARVMAEIRLGPEAAQHDNPLRRLLVWLARPRSVTLRLRPVWTLALVPVIAAILLMPSEPTTLPTPGAHEGLAQFVGHFPGAHSVEVVGSFNDWSRGALHLHDENHNGIWHGSAVLPAGQHEYMFVVDGERWVKDPLAGRYVDDGFGSGQENSVIFVRPASEP
jgi:hypothetical protein